jgi:glycosyltransferase involved in cell wall biosynthesis
MTFEKVSKRILLISGFRIFPANTGGHVHTGGIARSLARMGHRVSIYSLAGRQGDYRPAVMVGPSFRVDEIEPNLTEETHLGLTFGLLQAAGRRLNYPRVWQYALLHKGLVPRRLARALSEADIILSDMPWCPRVPGPWLDKPWFLVSHNLEHRLLEQADPRQRQFAGWMRNIEQRATVEYRDIFPCAETDRDFFRATDARGELRLPLIRCGVDPNSYRVAAGTREQIRAELGIGEADHLLVFSGSRFDPNVEALDVLKEFCKTERDFLARERVFFLALGSMAPAAMRDGALIATGRVPEVAPYFAAADAGLNPIVRGSGANVKLFEYLATRLPVISTRFGVRGTGLEPELDFVPYEPADLKRAIRTFTGSRTRSEWRAYADAVWARHRSSCDIEDLVRAAVAQRPEFAGP